MLVSKPFKKIEVKGRIHLGHQHELIQERRVQKADRRPVAVITGQNGQFETVPLHEADALGQVLESKFSAKPINELYIKDRGLVTSFGVFGAPGCGKTVLLMHLLEQVLKHEPGQPHKQFGALILDPKAALIDDVTNIVRQAGREKDLRIINTEYLSNPRAQKINVINCCLDPYELASVLVLAARSAGADVSEPYWFVEWGNLFKASLSVLQKIQRLLPESQQTRVNLRELLESVFDPAPGLSAEGRKERLILRLARELVKNVKKLPAEDQRDAWMDLDTLERFSRPDYAREVATVEALISDKLGVFRRSRLDCYSATTPFHVKPPFYEDIIQNGRIVLVSISPSEPELAKTLCTLIKCLFQRTVLARRELLSRGIITNSERPLVIACDEYSQIASEVPGEPMGDGQFLSLAREYGCMAILATQSVHVLEASSLRDSWRSVFSNFGAKIYMRLVDNETAEEATKLAGESDWKIFSTGESKNHDGSSLSRQRELRERKNLPSSILTQVLGTAQAVVVGSLDGGETVGTYFLQVPDKRKAEQEKSANSREEVQRA